VNEERSGGAHLSQADDRSVEDDWNIGRTSLLARHLAVLLDVCRRRARPRKHPRNREIFASPE
jgi:hypothetical protein